MSYYKNYNCSKMTTVQPIAASLVSTFLLYKLRLSDFFHLHCVENYGIKFIIHL